jgi:hypothetical protein
MLQLTVVLWALLAVIGFLLILLRPDGYEILCSHKILFQFYFPFVGICHFLILHLNKKLRVSLTTPRATAWRNKLLVTYYLEDPYLQISGDT